MALGWGCRAREGVVPTPGFKQEDSRGPELTQTVPLGEGKKLFKQVLNPKAGQLSKLYSATEGGV